MKLWPLIGLCIAAVLGTSAAQARAPADPRRNDREMLLMDPSARIEQRCNARGMGLVGREHDGMKPDELVAYAYADTRLKGEHIEAPGAAIRSKGVWYHFSYSCETTDDGLDIRSFRYSLGEAIPKDEWGAHFLVAP